MSDPANIAARPTAGFQYLVVAGDRLDTIEKIAYGSIQGILEEANPQLNGRPISLENRPTIYPGDVLVIPVLATREALKNAQVAQRLENVKDPDKMSIIIDGLEIQSTSARILRTMDTAADGWTARFGYTAGRDPELDRRLLPYSYPQAQAYIGGELLTAGVLYGVNREATKQGKIVDLEGFSFTKDMVDSTINPPYEFSNISLQDLATKLARKHGIGADFDFDPGGPFDRVTADPMDSPFTFLARLVTQRGGLFSSSPSGNALFTKTTEAKTPVGTIEEGERFPIGWGARFDGTLLYNVIRAIGETPGNPTAEGISRDDNVPRSRFITITADETSEAGLQAAADWKRSKQLADALTIPFPVSGWYAPNGELWRENTLVTVVSPTIFVPRGFTFLIRQVEYVDEASGKTATLSLVPPEVYTGNRIVLPWEAI
jgi:prophage tail gpP-like protein